MEKKLTSFLKRYLSKREIEGLSDEMEIENDLGISGDDGYEFFEDFCKTFSVETNCNSDNFFHSEPSFDLFKFWHKDTGVKKKLTIGMLKEIIRQRSFKC